jgi:DNA-binding MarR family transcriptional regulator
VDQKDRSNVAKAGVNVARIRAASDENRAVPAESGAARAASASAQQSRMALTVSRPELLVDGSDTEFRRLVHGLFSFLARHETIRAGHARTIGLAGIEYTVLISIAHLAQGGDVSISAVAQHLRLTGAFITNVCNRLVSLKLIGKATDEKDRRRVVLTLTDEGRRRLERLAPTQREINDVEFGCLSAKEFKCLLDLIERMIVSADQAVALQQFLTVGREAKVK